MILVEAKEKGMYNNKKPKSEFTERTETNETMVNK